MAAQPIMHAIEETHTMRFTAPLLTLALFASVALAQGPAPAAPAGPPPTGLVVGSGNFFSPIVSNLDKAVAFYRDGLGLTAQAAATKIGRAHV